MHDVPPFPLAPRGAVVTVGTFDGVHRGHWRVLEEVRRSVDSTSLSRAGTAGAHRGRIPGIRRVEGAAGDG